MSEMSMNDSISIFWFRRDLRLSDNPGLLAAVRSGKVLPIYIHDSQNCSIGSASKVWLHHSLEKLQKSLNGNLNIYIGAAKKVVSELITHYKIDNVFYSNYYEKEAISEEKQVITILRENGVNYKSYNSCYLWNPSEIIKDNGSYYKIFTAYKNKTRFFNTRAAIQKPDNILCIKDELNKVGITDLNLLPKKDWHHNMIARWDIGEEAALLKLSDFVQNNLLEYKKNRDYPSLDTNSKLSPHLHFGEISPNQIWEAVTKRSFLKGYSDDVEHFLSELIWREFACYLIYHFPDMNERNFQAKFDSFKWEDNRELLKAWQKGNTGYPIIDAGMRELWETGSMHNRVRMIVASFLVKNLMIDWKYGKDWFLDCLLDADIQSNSMNWQWVSGCGVDYAPYFRIFNPVTQGEKFDIEGKYTRKFVPELKNLPDKYLFKPWEAPNIILHNAGIVLGKNYPKPIIDFKESRTLALAKHKTLL